MIGMFAFLLGASFIGHLFTMIVMRWRHAGRVCSGDYNSDLQIWSLEHGEDNKPYLPLTGTWLFYNNASMLYAILMTVGATAFTAGLND